MYNNIVIKYQDDIENKEINEIFLADWIKVYNTYLPRAFNDIFIDIRLNISKFINLFSDLFQ